MDVVLPPDLAAALDAYARRVEERFSTRLRLVRLFGSWARGQARAGSDVDVAVVVDGLSCDERDAAIADAVDVGLDHDVTISPYVVATSKFDALSRRERRIVRDVMHEGIAL